MSRHTMMRENFRVLGLCGVCGREPEQGYKTCKLCLVRAQKAFQKRKSEGLCGCGNPLAKNRKKCVNCLSVARERVATFRSSGLCYCGKRQPKKNYTLCQQCLDKRKAKSDLMRSQGKCICGEPCGVKFKFCPRCRNRATIRMEEKLGDKTFAFLVRLRGCIYNAIKKRRKYRKTGRTEFLMGCTFDFIRQHIESLFPPGMSWDNMEFWHVDHYIPCSAFSLQDERQQRLCNNWRNLRPMWASENLSKKNKMPHDYKDRLAELEIHVPHFDPMSDPLF